MNARDVIFGAVAAAGATWLMDLVTTKAYELEPKEVQDRENAARGGKTAYVIAAEKLSEFLEADLDEEETAAIGSAIHWLLGISSGAVYGALRPHLRRPGSGLLFGFAFWLLMDEGALTALGLTPPPQEFPWQTHARGLVGHLVLGATLEGAFAALEGAGRALDAAS